MEKKSQAPAAKSTERYATYQSYFIGYILSVGLTLAAYYFVNRHVQSEHHAYAHQTLVYAVMGLASVQFLVQLYFFLHLGRESKPRWNLVTFGFMMIVLVIVVFGTIWIMDNLNYHMMSAGDTEQYMHEHEGL